LLTSQADYQQTPRNVIQDPGKSPLLDSKNQCSFLLIYATSQTLKWMQLQSFAESAFKPLQPCDTFKQLKPALFWTALHGLSQTLPID
jgi:hypothetical protein